MTPEDEKLAADILNAPFDLAAPFKRADAFDWMHLDRLLGDSAYGKFWREVLWEVKDALRRGNHG